MSPALRDLWCRTWLIQSGFSGSYPRGQQESDSGSICVGFPRVVDDDHSIQSNGNLLVALTLFAIREIVFMFRGHSENGLWACYVALLLIGIGLVVRSAACNAVGCPMRWINLACG